MVLSEAVLENEPAHVKTATLHWVRNDNTGLYHPRGNPKVFGRSIRPCTLVELLARHRRVEIVEA